MKKFNYILQLKKYDKNAAILFSYHLRGKWGRRLWIFKCKNK